MADALVLGASTLVCGFKSHLPHQSNIIRTRFRLEMDSDLLFSLSVSRILISVTAWSSDPNQSPEARGNRNGGVRDGIVGNIHLCLYVLYLLQNNELRKEPTMKKLLSCEFNIDTACVELKYNDGSMIAIDCTSIENELDASMLQRGELDWLIYNKPLEYAELVLNGGIEEYIKGTPEHRLMD